MLFALGFMTVGGVLLSVAANGDVGWSVQGALCVLLATVAWAIDNTASRKLAERPPSGEGETDFSGRLQAGMTATTEVELWKPDAWLGVRAISP